MKIDDIKIDDIKRPKPHPAKKLLKEFDIPLWKTARYLKVSYYHCSKVLSGHVPASGRLKIQLNKLVNDLKKRKLER